MASTARLSIGERLLILVWPRYGHLFRLARLYLQREHLILLILLTQAKEMNYLGDRMFLKDGIRSIQTLDNPILSKRQFQRALLNHVSFRHCYRLHCLHRFFQSMKRCTTHQNLMRFHLTRAASSNQLAGVLSVTGSRVSIEHRLLF